MSELHDVFIYAGYRVKVTDVPGSMSDPKDLIDKAVARVDLDFPEKLNLAWCGDILGALIDVQGDEQYELSEKFNADGTLMYPERGEV